jgi:glycosyltransferase involved in cell wall biosynthesis
MPASAGSTSGASARRRRALILVEDLPVPFDRRVWNEARTLHDAGWRVTVVCPRGTGARRWHERIDGIEIFRYPLPTTAAGLLAHALEYAVAIPATLLLSLLAWRGKRFEVVHACNPPDFLFPIGGLFRVLGSAFVYDQHDLAPEVYLAQGGRAGGLVHRFLLRCERATYRLADAVLSTNGSYRRFAMERGGVAAERVHVVRSAPDPQRLFRVEPDAGLRGGRAHLVAYLGTMGPQDGVDGFVDAAAAVERRRPGLAKFVAMGGGNQLEPLRADVERRGLASAIDFTGRVPDEMVRTVLSTADVGVSPDPQNGFNEFCTMNKTLEYMAIGLPVVAYDLEETRVSAGDAAEYARPNDPEALADAILGLLDDPERRRAMGEAGRRRIAAELSWRASAEHLREAYEAAVTRRASHR